MLDSELSHAGVKESLCLEGALCASPSQAETAECQAEENYSPQTPFSRQIDQLWRQGRHEEAAALIRQKIAQVEADPAITDEEYAARVEPPSAQNGDIFPHGARKRRKQSQRLVRKVVGERISQVLCNSRGEKIDLATALLPGELAGHPSASAIEAASPDGDAPAAAERQEACPLPEPAIADIAPRPVRRGRPLAMDEFLKGKLVGLMSHGLTFRQAASLLGVDHKTVLNTMKRDPELAVEVADARLAAVAKPLMKVIAESERSWRAATWLVKYLEDRMCKVQEETPEERSDRWERRESAWS